MSINWSPIIGKCDTHSPGGGCGRVFRITEEDLAVMLDMLHPEDVAEITNQQTFDGLCSECGGGPEVEGEFNAHECEECGSRFGGDSKCFAHEMTRAEQNELRVDLDPGYEERYRR